MTLLTAEEVETYISYDPETGRFTWLVDNGPNARAGSPAGSYSAQGYLRITINWKQYRAHRLAWLLMRGSWPSRTIDHVNGDRADNRICNLRLATQQENTRNRRCRLSKTGLKGVYPVRDGKYRAKIQVDGKRRHLGYFDSAEKAQAAYAAAARELFGEFARVS